jgi:hypothetical protein
MNTKQRDEISNEINKCIMDLRIMIKKEHGIDKVYTLPGMNGKVATQKNK